MKLGNWKTKSIDVMEALTEEALGMINDVLCKSRIAEIIPAEAFDIALSAYLIGYANGKETKTNDSIQPE